MSISAPELPRLHAPDSAPDSLSAVPLEPPAVVRWAHLLRAGVTSAAVVLLLGLSALALVSTPRTTETGLDLSTSRLDRVFEHNRCSTEGFDGDVTPTRALIRRPSGETAIVSFDRGWQIFSGERPGTLMAVCLGPAAD